MDVQAKVGQIRSIVASARSMPMSASCVINRTELLAHLDELATLLQAELGDADTAGTPSQAQAQAERILSEARHRQRDMLDEHEVYRTAHREAERILSEARHEADELRRETDDYVDERLATFELTLQKTLEAVGRGRERLRGRSDLDELRSGSAAPLPDPFRD